ncbi:GFA family protein [Aurantimonas aggregata]|uniref:GFA family protein n=1 Tax=Aurantimonas aggregata TaxID=2047720 RepID=UPI0031B607C1
MPLRRRALSGRIQTDQRSCLSLPPLPEGSRCRLQRPYPARRELGGLRRTLRDSSVVSDLLRGFCPSCGTSLFTHRLSSGWTGLTSGSLDDPDRFKPEAHTWVSAKQPWVVIADQLPQYDEMPPT